jgi:gamma-glutamyltranspeptidase / glutathione hydrolase
MATVPVSAMLDKTHASHRAERIDASKARCTVEPSRFPELSELGRSETIFLTVADAEGNIVSLIQSNYAGFGSGIVPAGAGFMLHNRGALFTLEPGQANTLAPRKRPLHTIIPGFMEREGTRIGFGIMGGWNQAQAHAQFVSNIADHGLTIQQALEAGRFTKGTFQGCDVQVEALVPESVRTALQSLGHEVSTVARRTSVFGYGQAVMSTPDDVRFGASDPRHDGAAIPQRAPVFTPATPAAAGTPGRSP